jgi:hypothetical protein
MPLHSNGFALVRHLNRIFKLYSSNQCAVLDGEDSYVSIADVPTSSLGLGTRGVVPKGLSSMTLLGNTKVWDVQPEGARYLHSESTYQLIS